MKFFKECTVDEKEEYLTNIDYSEVYSKVENYHLCFIQNQYMKKYLKL